MLMFPSILLPFFAVAAHCSLLSSLCSPGPFPQSCSQQGTSQPALWDCVFPGSRPDPCPQSGLILAQIGFGTRFKSIPKHGAPAACIDFSRNCKDTVSLDSNWNLIKVGDFILEHLGIPDLSTTTLPNRSAKGHQLEAEALSSSPTTSHQQG